MPFITVVTSLSENVFDTTLIKDLVKFLAPLLKKPENHMCWTLTNDAIMRSNEVLKTVHF